MEDIRDPACEQEPIVNTRMRVARAEQRIVDSRLTGDGVHDEANVQKEGFKDPEEYWGVQLSEPMPATRFVQMIYAHTSDNRTAFNSEIDKLKRLDIWAALKLAIEDGQPWIKTHNSKNPNKWMLDPLAATRWIARLPKRAHVLPPSLRAFLAADKQSRGDEGMDVISTGLPGRPTSMHLLEAEMRRRDATGELLPRLSNECEYLARWLHKVHPKEPAATAKTIENRLRGVYRELKQKPPK
jgi:hypothetical protein